MTEQERLDSFLDIFRDLENRLSELAGVRGDGFSSFSRNLQTVYQSKRVPILRIEDNFSFLKSCSEMRNIATHNNDICIPTQACYDRFVALAERIIHPKRAIDIATTGKRLMTARPDTAVLPLARSMLRKGLSHVPVLDGERVVGVFSATTLFDRFKDEGNLALDGDSTISDFQKQIVLQGHGSETFLFCAPETVITDFAQQVESRLGGRTRRVAAVLVTADGTPAGRLMGIITGADLVKG